MNEISDITSKKAIIDCDSDPEPLDGCTIKEHQKGGMLETDFSDIEFYLSERQKNGSVRGDILMEELPTLPDKIGAQVLNANVLDFLFKKENGEYINLHFIPEEWKEKDQNGNPQYKFFPGTRFKRHDGCLFIAGFCFYQGKPERCFNWLGTDFNNQRPMAIMKINSANKKAQS